MSKKNYSAYEEYLNDFYKNEMDISNAVEELIYLQSKYWGMHVARWKTTRIILSSKAGQLIRSSDPIRFNVGYNEWNS